MQWCSAGWCLFELWRANFVRSTFKVCWLNRVEEQHAYGMPLLLLPCASKNFKGSAFHHKTFGPWPLLMGGVPKALMCTFPIKEPLPLVHSTHSICMGQWHVQSALVLHVLVLLFGWWKLIMYILSLSLPVYLSIYLENFYNIMEVCQSLHLSCFIIHDFIACQEKPQNEIV